MTAQTLGNLRFEGTDDAQTRQRHAVVAVSVRVRRLIVTNNDRSDDDDDAADDSTAAPNSTGEPNHSVRGATLLARL
jgi:hypothetical protein